MTKPSKTRLQPGRRSTRREMEHDKLNELLPFTAEKIEQVAMSDLTTGNRTLRLHGKAKLSKLEANIRRFGFIVPVVADEGGRVLAGEARLAGARSIGLERVPVIRVDHLSAAAREAFRIADNRLVELSSWDEAALRDVFETIIEIDDAFELDLTGFDTAQIDTILEIDLNGEEETDPDDAWPGPASPPSTRIGDLWLLGDHRLLCGDATDAGAVKKALDGAAIDLTVTDPPYNVRIQGHVRGAGRTQHREFVQASGEMDEAAFAALLRSALSVARDHSRQGALLYSFMDWRSIELLLRCGRQERLTLLNLAIWNKTNGGMGSLYRSKHELCPVFKVGAAPHVNNIQLGASGRYRTNVWDYAGVNTFGHDRDEALTAHPTVKPVAMIADIIKDVTKRGDCVFDPFAGSGTILIGAQRTGRRACCIELDPIYVDTAIARFERRFGVTAIHAETGETVDQVRKRRAAEAHSQAGPQPSRYPHVRKRVRPSAPVKRAA